MRQKVALDKACQLCRQPLPPEASVASVASSHGAPAMAEEAAQGSDDIGVGSVLAHGSCEVVVTMKNTFPNLEPARTLR